MEQKSPFDFWSVAGFLRAKFEMVLQDCFDGDCWLIESLL